MNTAQPGWYADPSVAGQLRYFDGSSWTEHVQADPGAVNIQQVAAPPPQQHYGAPAHAAAYHPAPQVQVNQINVAQQPQKSVGVALLLTFFFGPFGMLYSTIAGGLIMLAANVVLGTLTLGLFLFISWPIQMVWAAVAASNSNKATMPTVAVSSMGHGYQAPVAPQAQWQQPVQQQPQPHQPAPYAPPQPPGPAPALPQSTGGQGFPAPPATNAAEPSHTAELPQADPGPSNWYS